MPRGTFPPFTDTVRFFARIHAATLECPFCGRLLFIGPRARDAKAYDRVTRMVRCPSRRADGDPQGGCGRTFLVGIVAYPLRARGRLSPKPQTPPDQIPEPHQLAEIRAVARERLARLKKTRHRDGATPIAAPLDPEALDEA